MAGTPITPARKIIFVEGAQFRSATSEELIQRLGGMNNFIAMFQHSEKQFFINGNYSVIPPTNALDGLTFFQFNATIIDVWMFVQSQSGATSGTTELDIKRATTPGGAFTTIFSTTPKIQFNAGDFIWIHVGSAVSNTTAPVLSVSNVNAGDALRCDLIQKPTGLPNSGAGAGILVHYYPR